MGSPDIHSFHISGVGSAAMRNFTAIICLLVAAQASAMIWNRPIYGPGGIQPIYGPDGKQPIIYGPGGIRPIYGPDGINPNPIIGGPDGVNPNPIIGGPDGVRPTPDNLYYPVCPAGSIVKIPISELEPSLAIHLKGKDVPIIGGPDGVNPNPIIGGDDGVQPDNGMIGGPDGIWRPIIEGPDGIYRPIIGGDKGRPPMPLTT